MNRFTEPKVTQRQALVYAGVRTQVTMDGLEGAIPRLLDVVENWLAQIGLPPVGAPLIRYHVIDMNTVLDISVGVPVSEPVEADQTIAIETLPAGRYASLVFTGNEYGVQGNGALIKWIADNGLMMDYREGELGEVFEGRVEYLLDGPDDDPNPSNWRTEVAIKLID